MRDIGVLDPNANEVIWQIGAFDGVDSVGGMINKNHNWSFHLFEPNDKPFKELCKKHLRRSNVSVYKLAVTDTESQLVNFYVSTVLDDPEKDWAPMVCGLTPDVVDKHGLKPRKIVVSAIHFRKLARLTGSTPTLIVTDTEGNDQRFVDLVSIHRPKVYKFEICHMSKEVLENHRFKLRNWGYVRNYTDALDEVWVRSDAK